VATIVSAEFSRQPLVPFFAMYASRAGYTLGAMTSRIVIGLFHAAMTFIGSIDLGWHYALDGIVAGASAPAIWRAAASISPLPIAAVSRQRETSRPKSPNTDKAVGNIIRFLNLVPVR